MELIQSNNKEDIALGLIMLFKKDKEEFYSYIKQYHNPDLMRRIWDYNKMLVAWLPNNEVVWLTKDRETIYIQEHSWSLDNLKEIVESKGIKFINLIDYV